MINNQTLNDTITGRPLPEIPEPHRPHSQYTKSRQSVLEDSYDWEYSRSV
jgi:hypothetical protein